MNWNEYLQLNDSVMRLVNPSDVQSFFDVLAKVRDSEGTVWVLGNGGSASAASHAVADFGKTSKANGARPLFTLAPSEMISMQTAYSNDISFEQGFASTIRDFAKPNDAVWIISVSGTSPNLVEAVRAAREKGLAVLSTVGERGSAMASDSDVGILIPSSDYQVVENGQILLMHWFTKLLAVKID